MSWLRELVCGGARSEGNGSQRGQAAASDEKTIFLVRHAQSEQNIASAKLAQGDFSALGKIVALGYDPPLSADGKQQLEDASIRLATFAADRGIDLIVHSPLQRAAATARSLFSNSGLTMVVKPELQEAGVLENFMPSLMDSRIQSLCQWLDERDEKVIALVGHGQYFKRLQRAGEVQPNVSVIECKYTRGDCICRPIAVPFEGYGMPD